MSGEVFLNVAQGTPFVQVEEEPRGRFGENWRRGKRFEKLQ